MADVVVAGHVCLDVIPRFLGEAELVPGNLVEVGPAEMATGGCVSNVGRALDRLGVSVRLAGRIGDDPFGRIVAHLLGPLGSTLFVSPDGATSYSIVLSPPGQDRTFLHMPGENDRFTSSDLDPTSLREAKVLHFGYPPLMAQMFQSEGDELVRLLKLAKDERVTTSLDLALPDPHSPAGRAPWRRILERVLPLCDLLFPSVDELSFMLGCDPRDEERMLGECLDMGAGTVVLKRGERGLSARSPTKAAEHPCFRVEVAGTTGSGDATIAGFLKGHLLGGSLADCLRAGCAVGACSVEASDAVSGVRSWPETEARLAAGWATR